MAKRLVAKVGEYQKDGQTKGEYVKIGVIMENQNGEYVLIDPTVSLSGVLAKQNVMAMNKGDKVRDNVICSIFDESNQQRQGGQQNYQQRPQQGYQQPQQQLTNPPANNYQSQPEPDFSFDDD